MFSSRWVDFYSIELCLRQNIVQYSKIVSDICSKFQDGFRVGIHKM